MDISNMSGMQSVDLLDIIGHELADDKRGYCMSMSSRTSPCYLDWEVLVAIPALSDKGYYLHGSFYTLEVDSCGPLSRGIVVEKDGVKSMAWYG